MCAAVCAASSFANTMLVNQFNAGSVATIGFSLVYFDDRVCKEAFDLELMMMTLDAPGLQGAPA